MRFASAPRKYGTGSTTGARSGGGQHARRLCARGLRSSFCRSSTGRCMQGTGHFDGQRASKEVKELGTLDREAVQEGLSGEADAASDVARWSAYICLRTPGPSAGRFSSFSVHDPSRRGIAPPNCAQTGTPLCDEQQHRSTRPPTTADFACSPGKLCQLAGAVAGDLAYGEVPGSCRPLLDLPVPDDASGHV